MAWVTPQPLDTGDPGSTALTAYNLTLEKFSDGVKTTADKNDGLFVDQFHPYLAVLDKARRSGIELRPDHRRRRRPPRPARPGADGVWNPQGAGLPGHGLLGR